MKQIIIYTITLFLVGCNEYKKELMPLVRPTGIKILYLPENENGIFYTVDTSTGLCFAIRGAHGFTCIPCDSLKKLETPVLKIDFNK
tara:strand:+ start:4240 stop:4500 length:261 start_codon:yes stop_codon:yes gene_type:complete